MIIQDFEIHYYLLKEKGFTDEEVAKALYIGYSTLRRYKKVLGIRRCKVTPNKQGVTEAELRQAEQNGLTRELVFRRVRAYGWTVEKAISDPIIPLNKRRTRGE